MITDTDTPVSENDVKLLGEVSNLFPVVKREISQRIIGQHALVRDIFIALLAQGHCLMVGVPGLAKTLMVKTLANTLDLDFRRIQFTPDLMPGDILGSELIEEGADGRRSFRFVPGPIFGQLILADEINRTPPKTQAALLEAMQERRVTVSGQTHLLRPPFFVLATQNPIEQEGTYPLPEAQLDRFMFCLKVDYPSRDEEVEILQRTTTAAEPVIKSVLGGEKIMALQNAVRSRARAKIGGGVRRQPRPCHASGHGAGVGTGETVRALGRRPAGVAVSGPCGQGFGRAGWPFQRGRRGHRRGGADCAAPPCAAQLPGRSGRGDGGHPHC